LNKNLKQIYYLKLSVQFAKGKSGLSTHTMFTMLPLCMKTKHLKGKIIDLLKQ